MRRERPGSAAGGVSRQRFRRRQWARRWAVWRRVLAALLVAGLVATGVWVVYGSDLLVVEQVEVEGTDLLADQRVRRVAAVPEGQQLASLDLASVRSRLQALAPVRRVEVHRAWPDGVRVVVEEREALAVVSLAGRLRGMDAEGVLFRGYQQPPGHLPRVEMPQGTRAAAMQEAARVIGSLPEGLAGRVRHVEVATVDQISLVLRDGRTVVWGSAEDSDLKAEVAGALLGARKASTYDVSVPGQPVTRG